MDEGSSGDFIARIKYLKFRTEIAKFFIDNPVTSEKVWKDKLYSIFEKTKYIYTEIIDLSEFNETDLPQNFHFYVLRNKIYQLSIKNVELNKKIEKIHKNFKKLQKLDQIDQQEKESVLNDFAEILYEMIDKNCQSIFNKKDVILEMINNKMISEKILSLVFENIENIGNSLRNLMIFKGEEENGVFYQNFLEKLNLVDTLQLEMFLHNYLEDDFFVKNQSFFSKIKNVKDLRMRETSKLTNKTISLICSIFTKIKSIFLHNFWNLDKTSIKIFSSQMKFLESISVGPSMIDSDSIFSLSESKTIKKLSFRKCPKITHIPKIDSLDYLSIYNCTNFYVSPEKSINRVNLPNLKTLHLNVSRLTDEQLENIKNEFHDQLEEICLNYSVLLTDKGIECLQYFLKLQSVEAISVENLKGEIKMEWPNTITKFNFAKNPKIKDDFCLSLSKNNLELLNLEYSLISDETLKLILENSSSSLKVLNLKNCKNLNHKKLSKTFSQLNLIEHLSLENTTSKSLLKINKENLLSLKIYNSKINPKIYQNVFPKSIKLRKLKIVNCCLDDSSMEMIGNHLKNLTSFSLSDDFVSEDSFAHISKLHPHLSKLNLFDCKKFNLQAMKNLFQYNPKIKQIKIEKMQNLNLESYNVIGEKLGSYLQKLKEYIQGGKLSSFLKFDNLYYFKGTTYGLDNIINALKNAPKMRKIYFVHNVVYNEINCLKDLDCLEFFLSLNGTIMTYCSNDPLFLKEWGSSNVKNSLRYL